jgi:hypothetical protein
VGSEERDVGLPREGSHWHLDRRVPLTLIVSVLLIIGHQIYLNAKFEASNESLMKDMTHLTTDRIHKQTVVEMFRSRDLEVSILRDSVNEVHQELRELNALMREAIVTGVIRKNGDG